MSEFDEQAAMVQEFLVAGRRISSVVTEYFASLLAAGMTREEALLLTRDYQRQFLNPAPSDDA